MAGDAACPEGKGRILTKSLYFTAAQAHVATDALLKECIIALKKSYPKLGLFRAFPGGPIEEDTAFADLYSAAEIAAPLEDAWGVVRSSLVTDEEAAMVELLGRFEAYAAQCDAVVIVGILESDPVYPGALGRIGRAAAHLGASVVPVLSGKGRSAAEVGAVSHLVVKELEGEHAPVRAMIVGGAPSDLLAGLPEDGDHARVLVVADAKNPVEIGEAGEALREVMEFESGVVTPLSFTAALIDRAGSDRKRIVLPESDDDRVLIAADELLRRGVADLILLGDGDNVQARAAELGLDLSDASIISPTDPEALEKYATEYAKLREKKGMTYEKAYEVVQDISFFGTMMVYMGDADGMVSGAAHTTAHTIVPSFQTIKTKPGVDLVSSCFLMLMEDRVYVYGDCAVTPNPTPEQLASIAISSAETAQQFGIEPRVAMLSYSTGSSGHGVSVDAVIEATKIAQERRPDLAIEGPIQYDAAVDETVAAKKLPGSPVAGKANVFIFPDLNAGNIGYKAVQRSSGAVAVGPVLQGLNKPVNDLSRGALVEDIVNTVAITAIQAQQ